MKPVELVSNALKFSGDLNLRSMLPLSFRGLLPQGGACGEAGRERQPVASVACKDTGSTAQRFLPIFSTAALSGQDLESLVTLRIEGRGSSLPLPGHSANLGQLPMNIKVGTRAESVA